MIKLLGISGSLRRGSFNTLALQAMALQLPEGVSLEIRTLHGIPLYDADVEASAGIPAPVTALKELVAAADGVILATPEYNNGIPGVFKNAVDWLSRPPADVKRVFSARPFALLGASPGGFGTILSQAAWLPVLRTLGTEPWFGGRLMLSRANTLFDSGGKLTDTATQEQLRQFVLGFSEFVRRHSASH